MKFPGTFFNAAGAGILSLTLTLTQSHAKDLSAQAEPPAPAYQDVESIIAINCGYCHTGGADAQAGVSLDSEAEVVAQAAKLHEALNSGFMPYGDSEWRTTTDGIKLLAYLKSKIPPAPSSDAGNDGP